MTWASNHVPLPLPHMSHLDRFPSNRLPAHPPRDAPTAAMRCLRHEDHHLGNHPQRAAHPLGCDLIMPPSTDVSDLPPVEDHPSRRVKPKDKWPEEWTQTLLRLRAEGLSYTRIAQKLGTSRGAISGKLHRLNGYKRPPEPSVERRSSARYFETWAARKARLKRQRQREMEKANGRSL